MNQELITLNKERWDKAKIPSSKGPAFKAVADVLMKPENRLRYEKVATSLRQQGYNIPWWFIAVAHYREAGFNNNSPRWDTYLGNGQPLNKKTTIVPAGRGPFDTWEEGAVDALVNAAPYAAKNKDWSIGGSLTKLEEYNGLGYFNKGRPSPYIWAGTDQYVKGKYTSDGVYNANAIDKQLGCAGILKFMGVFKTSVGGGTLGGAGAVVATAGAAAASNSWWTFFTDHWFMFAMIFVGIGIAVDLSIAIYNNEKNRLKVKDGKTK